MRLVQLLKSRHKHMKVGSLHVYTNYLTYAETTELEGVVCDEVSIILEYRQLSCSPSPLSLLLLRQANKPLIVFYKGITSYNNLSHAYAYL